MGKMVDRVCKCGTKFTTTVGDKYCKECKKLVLSELHSSGYLTPRPYPTMIKPENRGAGQFDPSPGDENAVRILEGD